MYEMKITLDSREDAEDLLAVLSNAEEEGELSFSFGVSTREVTRRELVESLGFRLKK